MNERLERTRQLCFEQAEGFINAAKLLEPHNTPHIVYHLSLLALEEVGKAIILASKTATHPNLDEDWVDRFLSDHRRKLQWAVWSPLIRIDPADFQAAWQFADRAHSLRLASLYVDANADLTDLPPSGQVTKADAEQALSLADARLAYERTRGPVSGDIDGLARWFLDTVADQHGARLLLSNPFVAKYEALNGDARAWASWARDEIKRQEQENLDLLNAQLARPGAPKGLSKPRWRGKTTVYTPSHSLRAKILARWNNTFDPVKLVWLDKKDRLTLQITLDDNAPLPAVAARLTSLAKLVVACLNIGSIGYFWFERAGFEKMMFQDIRDLEVHRRVQFGPNQSFWGNDRAVALTDQHIDNAVHCMFAFMPLSEADAEPIFGPYLHGLAFIAKSDLFYNFDTLARQAFVATFAGALRHFGGWSGKPEEFEEKFHEALSPIIAERAHRDQVFRSLRPEGDPVETSLGNLRTAKQIADLYLILCGQDNWRNILPVGT